MDDIEIAIAGLESLNPKFRNKCVLYLSQSKNARAVRALIKALNDPEVSINAAKALGEIKDKSAVAGLIKMLKTQIFPLRGRIVEALGKIGKPSVPALVKTLYNGNTDEKVGAALALGVIKDASTVPILIQKLRDPDSDVRCAVIRALGNIGDTSVTSFIIAEMESETINVWMQAIETLGVMNDPSAISALTKALKYKKTKRYAALTILEMARSNPGLQEPLNVVPILVELLKTEPKYWIPDEISLTLERAIKSCNHAEWLVKFCMKLEEGLRNLKKTTKGPADREIELKVVNLRISASKKINSLTEHKGILLSDIPRPPKGGKGIYQATRVIRNG